MSAVDDQLLISEDRATASIEALTDLRGTEAMVNAALSQRDAIHALTLAIQGIGKPAPVDSDKLADVIREAGERYSLGEYEGRFPFIARQVLQFLGIEDAA